MSHLNAGTVALCAVMLLTGASSAQNSAGTGQVAPAIEGQGNSTQTADAVKDSASASAQAGGTLKAGPGDSNGSGSAGVDVKTPAGDASAAIPASTGHDTQTVDQDGPASNGQTAEQHAARLNTLARAFGHCINGAPSGHAMSADAILALHDGDPIYISMQCRRRSMPSEPQLAAVNDNPYIVQMLRQMGILPSDIAALTQAGNGRLRIHIVQAQ